MTEAHLATLRRHMVEVIAIHADLMGEELGKAALGARVMAAMGRVPRHLFVPAPLAPFAYQDTPLPIGFGKTISQPFMVALMTDLLDPRPHETVLEVGAGLGYQTAVLAGLAGRVWSVEIVEEFAAAAELLLGRLGHANVKIRVGDGSRGWAEHGPFDKILVAAAPQRVPAALLAQLKPGGRMVLPRLRRPEFGQPRRTSGAYLRFCAGEIAWREDKRRECNGLQFERHAGDAPLRRLLVRSPSPTRA